MKRFLLDCTLRDGGYINDWNFGKDNIAYIFERQLSTNVDFIELGFIDQRREYDANRTILPNTGSFGTSFGAFKNNDTKLVAMIDYGTCGLENIQPKSESCLDGIRVIFKKDKMVEAISFCKDLKDLGYLVFVQAVSITSYSDDELKNLIGLVNQCKPYVFSMVDTYGLLEADSLNHIISIVNENLDKSIILGYHAHNNFQLGYANTVNFLNSKLDRDILVDGTLYGMGKSAGNAPIELIALYMNKVFDKNYDVLQMQEAISTCIFDMYASQPWGYSLFYYIAAANECHPNYVAYLLNKRTLSISAINEILRSIPSEKKLEKDIDLIEKMYLDYQKVYCDDSKVLSILSKELSGNKVLILGPGKTIKLQQNSIKDFIIENKPTIISINYFNEDFDIQYLFLTNSKRYIQIANMIEQSNDVKLISTSNIRNINDDTSYRVNYCDLIDENAEFPDNSMVMLIKLLDKIGVTNISLAGFDGYSPDDINYFDGDKEYSFVKDKAKLLNEYASNFFKSLNEDISLSFITDTKYQF